MGIGTYLSMERAHRCDPMIEEAIVHYQLVQARVSPKSAGQTCATSVYRAAERAVAQALEFATTAGVASAQAKMQTQHFKRLKEQLTKMEGLLKQGEQEPGQLGQCRNMVRMAKQSAIKARALAYRAARQADLAMELAKRQSRAAGLPERAFASCIGEPLSEKVASQHLEPLT